MVALQLLINLVPDGYHFFKVSRRIQLKFIVYLPNFLIDDVMGISNHHTVLLQGHQGILIPSQLLLQLLFFLLQSIYDFLQVYNVVSVLAIGKGEPTIAQFIKLSSVVLLVAQPFLALLVTQLSVHRMLHLHLLVQSVDSLFELFDAVVRSKQFALNF